MILVAAILVVGAVPVVSVLVLARLQDALRLSSTLVLAMGAMVFPKLLPFFAVVVELVGMAVAGAIELVIESDSVRLVVRLHLLHMPMPSFLVVLSASVTVIVATVRAAAVVSQPQLLQHGLRQGQRPPVVPVLAEALVVRPAVVVSAHVVVVVVALVGSMVVVVVATLVLLLRIRVVAVILTVLLLVLPFVPIVVVVVAAAVVAAMVLILLLLLMLLLSSVGSIHVVPVVRVNIVSHVGSSVLAELILPSNVLLGALRLHGPAARLLVVADLRHVVRHLVHVPWWRLPPPIEKLHSSTNKNRKLVH